MRGKKHEKLLLQVVKDNRNFKEAVNRAMLLLLREEIESKMTLK